MKPGFKYLAISFLAAAASLFCAPGSGRAATIWNVPILMYHYIETAPATTALPGLYVPPAIFEDQLRLISQHKYNTLFISELASAIHNDSTLPSCSLALSFDDGYEDFYTQAFPRLKAYSLKGTLYVIINRLDTPGYLTRQQVREMAESGLVEIGSHTFNHPDLRAKKLKDADFEIRYSREELAKISGRPVTTLAYPYGYFNEIDEGLASSSGYLAAVSVNPGALQDKSDLWALKRLRPGQRTGAEFITWLDRWFKAKH
ncbi:MAG: polysaccharide deacetylase family protein [Patescibacteria group bacterium]